MNDHNGDPHWRLAHRYGKAPFSSPVNDKLVQMLQAVFSSEEAALVACFPRLSATAAQLAKRADGDLEKTKQLLVTMDRRGSILAYESGDQHKYALLPIIPGLFELFMCSGVDSPQRRSFAEAFEAYYDEKYYPPAIPDGVVKVIAVEEHIEGQPGVLPSDSVADLIESHDEYALAVCSCRHSRELTGEGCGLPKDVCMVFGPLARYVIQRKLARQADKAEMHDAARRAEKAGLVHLADNVAQANFLCSCCACCCAGLRTITEFNRPGIVANSHFIVEVDREACNDCGKCVRRCPTAALKLYHKKLLFKEPRCIGCGVCVSSCNKLHALSMVARPRYQPPHPSLGHFASDLGLRSIGVDKLLSGPLAGAYRSLHAGLTGALNKPVVLSQIDDD